MSAQGDRGNRPTSTIRWAGSSDIDDVHTIVRNAFSPYIERLGQLPKPMTEDYQQAVADGAVWVADDGGRVCGVLVLEQQEDYVLVDTIAVDPQLHGRGLGSALLRHAEQQAQDAGVAEVRLYTHELMTENLRFYPRRGYREIGREAVDGRARVFFAKPV